MHKYYYGAESSLLPGELSTFCSQRSLITYGVLRQRAERALRMQLSVPQLWGGMYYNKPVIKFPDFKPYLVKVGQFEVRWYGIMYLLGFACSYLLVRRDIRVRRLDISREVVENLYFYLIVGLIAGARLGYVVFYNLTYYVYRPLEIFAVWHGGMSFHGGLIGVMIAGAFFARKQGMRVLQLSDLIIPTAPIGLFFGRIGNFVNGELYGRPASVPWAMVFPEGGDIPRHPSQLYEALLEGVVLFSVLWIARGRMRKEGAVTALFLLLYGAIRFVVEFFREPDRHLGFILGPFSMGQVLSAFMILVGVLLMMKAGSRAKDGSA